MSAPKSGHSKQFTAAQSKAGGTFKRKPVRPAKKVMAPHTTKAGR